MINAMSAKKRKQFSNHESVLKGNLRFRIGAGGSSISVKLDSGFTLKFWTLGSGIL